MRLLLTGERAVFGAAGCAGCRSRITWCVSTQSTVGRGKDVSQLIRGKQWSWECWTLPCAEWGRMGRQIYGWMEQQEGGWETFARFRVSSARCSTTPTWRRQELPRSGLQGLPHTAITRRLIRGFPAHETRERARRGLVSALLTSVFLILHGVESLSECTKYRKKCRIILWILKTTTYYKY